MISIQQPPQTRNDRDYSQSLTPELTGAEHEAFKPKVSHDDERDAIEASG
jgi:hypothetical protein